ncbi:hypothetical protein ABZP36_007364 [Zizania latifolia]
MRFRLKTSQLHGSALQLLLLLLLLLAVVVQAQQAPTKTRTDPTEAAALNAVFARLGQTAATSWNISGDPCSGAATDSTDIDNDATFNPAIKCVCTDQNNTVCHITKLKIYSRDVNGVIPQELRNLTRLTYLGLGSNSFSGPLPSELGNLAKLEQFLDFNVIQNFTPTVSNAAKQNKSTSKTGVIVGVVVGVTVLSLVALVGIFIWRQKRRKLSLEQQELYSIVGRPNVFSYGELRSATENFSSRNLLGEGGYGSVYKHINDDY